MQFIPPERGGMRLIQFFPELGPPPHPRENPKRTLTHPSFPVRLGATDPQWSGPVTSCRQLLICAYI